MYKTQKIAGETVAAVLAGRNLTDTLNTVWRKEAGLEARHRGAIQDISYGTLRRYGEISFMLKQLIQRQDIEAPIHALLAISTYQLAWGRSAPHAIVDYAVKVASHINGGRAKGLVNGVLRNFLRRKDELMQAAHANPHAHWNHPEWWIAAMQRAWPDHWEQVLTANNSRPPMTLRVNLRKNSREAYLDALKAADIAAEGIGTQGIRLKQPVSVDQLPGFFEGLCSVQDAGAQWAAPLLNPAPGSRVLDACCAPGGKTGHLLEYADVAVTALDVDVQRLNRVRENLDRLGVSAKVVQGDAANPSQWWDGQPFDHILADVPCSATGVTRRHPDIKWLRRPDDFAQFATQQSSMLDALWGCLKPGGTLLYVTCSVFPEENAQQIEAFLSRTRNARQISLSTSLPNNGQLLPDLQQDGFYYALLAKD
ncbi:16S rRNA (cytosine(967)-C(5))-methyltransferase RsmB [Burkholderiaceae bacterium DAT-1]|nr:16S rRNA (cytosine(967)-C(5))-methyltransferase RsmB [Burkholderiaceae bacterium DAT-1]